MTSTIFSFTFYLPSISEEEEMNMSTKAIIQWQPMICYAGITLPPFGLNATPPFGLSVTPPFESSRTPATSVKTTGKEPTPDCIVTIHDAALDLSLDDSDVWRVLFKSVKLWQEHMSNTLSNSSRYWQGIRTRALKRKLLHYSKSKITRRNKQQLSSSPKVCPTMSILSIKWRWYLFITRNTHQQTDAAFPLFNLPPCITALLSRYFPIISICWFQLEIAHINVNHIPNNFPKDTIRICSLPVFFLFE